MKIKLDSFPLVCALADEYPDYTYSHMIVYSYLLCKYIWFNKKGKSFFESYPQIADSCRSKDSTVRASVNWLVKNGLVYVTKEGRKNVYFVLDKYNVYGKLSANSRTKPC